MRANCLQKICIFVFLGFKTEVVITNRNCSFDNSFALISNKFLDVSQFGNFGIKIRYRHFWVHLICLQNIFAIS